MDRTLKIACIGCGTIAQGYGSEQGGHIRSLLDSGKPVEVLLVDKNLAIAQGAAQKFGLKHFTDDVEDVLRDRTVDAALILTYNSTHVDVAIRCIEEGKHFFVEKPLAMSLSECERILDAQRRHGYRGKIVVGHRFRYASGVAEARSRFSHPDVIYGQLMDDRWSDDWWANDPALGGGSILSQGVHIIDTVQFLAGSDIDRVFAHAGSYTQRHRHGFDSAFVNLVFRNGALGALLVGDCGLNNSTSKFFVEMFKGGTESCVLDNRLKDARFYRKGEVIDTVRGGENFSRIIEHFVESILEDSSPAIPLVDGIKSIGVYEAIKKSIDERREISMSDILGDLVVG